MASSVPGPKFAGSIESLKARVAELRFFESGPDPVARDDRVYRDTFDASATRSVAWELNFLYPPPESQEDFAIEAVYYLPDGGILGQMAHQTYLPADSNISWSSFAGPPPQSGRWRLGLYKVELSVKDKLIASGEFVAADLPIEWDLLRELMEDLPWTFGKLSDDDRQDLRTLSVLAQKDLSLTASVAALPWVKQGLTPETRGALEYLALLAGQNLALARHVAGLSWIADDITGAEWNAIKFLTLLSGQDASLGQSVATLPWVVDSIATHEWQTLQHMVFFAREDPAIAHAIAGFPWFVNSITEEEFTALGDLRDLATQYVGVVRSLTGYSWVIDDLTGDDRFALWSLKHIAKKDLPLAKFVIGLPWVTDGMTSHEAWALNYLKELQGRDASLGTTVAGLPWFFDNITEQERWLLGNLDGIAAQDTSMARDVAGLPWMKFELSEDERSALSHLSSLLAQDVALAKQVAGMPFFTNSFEAQDKDALSSLIYLGANYPDLLADMTKQTWFSDGLDDQETALVIVLGTPPGTIFGPNNLRYLVAGHHGESREITVGLAKGVRLTTFQSQSDPASKGIIDELAEAVRVTEELIGVPFPRDQVTLVLATPQELGVSLDADYFEIDRGTHMVVDPSLPGHGETSRVLMHQAAHYYWGTEEAPVWFREGAADFLTSYLRSRIYGERLEDRVDNELARALGACDGLTMTTIQRLIDQLAIEGYDAHQRAGYFTCNYRRGELLFLELHKTLGASSFQSAWRELYNLAKQEGRPISEVDIYQAFLRQTNANTIGAFKEIYRRVHGGVLAG